MKRVLCFLLTAAMLLSMLSVCVCADSAPTVTAGNVSVQQGNSVTVSITAANFASVGSVDFTLYYDAEVFTVSDTYTGSMIDGSSDFLSVNTAIAGQITASAGTMDAFYDSGTLLNIYFDVSADCPAKVYSLALTVGNAYGTDLQPLSVSSVSGELTVTQREPEKKPFVLGGYCLNSNSYRHGDSFVFRLQNNNYYSDYRMASGDITVQYDPELFRVDSVELLEAMKKEDAVWSVNTDIAGKILISYASASNVLSSEMMDIHFTVIGNVDSYSYIRYSASGVYNEELFSYDDYEGSCYIDLSKAEEVIDHPDLWLETPRLVVGQQATSTLTLQKGAAVAAGDFVVTYDPTVLRCVSVTAAPGLSAAGGMVVIDDNFTDGTIKFPYINTEGYDEEDIPLVRIVWEPLRSDADHNIAAVSGSMVYDADFQPVDLEYVSTTGCIFVRTVIDPVCLVDGRTNYTCACGNSIDEDPVDKLGHDIQKTAANAPNCVDAGWYDYESCSRCDYTTRVDIPALGHDEVVHEAQVQTCLGIGWDTYVTCNRCDYSTYAQLPALGHRTIVSCPVLTDPLSIELVGDTPFTLEDGKYYSNNHTDNTTAEFYITALYDCELTLVAGVSSEQNYDKLIILHQDQQVLDISGLVNDSSVSLSLAAGDVITVRYQKDGSAQSYEDRGWVALQYEFVLADGYADTPSEDLEPDCVNAVVCSYCGATVKDVISHDYKAAFQWNDDHSTCQVNVVCKTDCGAQATVNCSVEESAADPEKTVHVATAFYDGQSFSQNLTCDNHLVVFQNWDGHEVCRGYFHLGRAIDIPSAPTKAADETYTYIFAGWDPQVTECQGDAIYTAVFEPVYIDYTVTFKNWDGTVLQEKTYHYGDEVTAPADPSKTADETYTYTFAGWDKEVVNCTGDTVYTAAYTPVYIDYTVTFKNWDGTVLQEKTYHYGDAVATPADPSREADAACTYTFAGWDKEVVSCAGNTAYTATYTATYIDYTVTFKNWDGTILQQKTYHYGDTVTPPQTPGKPAGVESTFVFVGWDTSVVPCAGDATYTAVFAPMAIDYTVRFVDEDGTVLQEKTYHYGDTVTAPTDPAKPADKTYTYRFAGWDKEVVSCVGDAVYTATYTPVYIEYTVTFKDRDGTTLQEQTYHYGDAVIAPAEPVKPADKTYTYTFAGWDKEVVSCTGEAVYTATYTPVYIEYTVTFKDEDGTVLQEKMYHYGDPVTAPADPAKPADETYTYTFAGWDNPVVDCAGNAVYTAVYTPVFIDYTVVFKDADGTVLQEKAYHYGDPVIAPADPSKAADATYSYAFAGWDKEVASCTGEAVYTATYTPAYIDYTVVFKNADGTVLSQAVYHYGDTVAVPNDPAAPDGTDPTWVFKGWDAEISGTCLGNAVYTAVFAAPYPRGDMNCDLQVTDADAVYLLRHTLFTDDYPILQSGDVNNDGQVTDADAVYLLRHTLFPQDYPLN